MDIQEQACWLTLVFKSGLPRHRIQKIIAIWCMQRERTLQAFFAAHPSLWYDTCQLDEKAQAKLLQVREHIAEEVTVAQALALNAITLLPVIDKTYPDLLRCTLQPDQVPPILFFRGDLQLLKRMTIAVIGSRHAQEESISFAYTLAAKLAERGINIISGYARGVDRAAYDGALSVNGCTTIVLPSGINTLSAIQTQGLLPLIAAGRVLLLSQFHPDAPWLVSRAMERNRVVTGLAQAIVVAEANTHGGTWNAAKGAFEQHKPLYVYQSERDTLLPGNKALIDDGGQPIALPLVGMETILAKEEHVVCP